MRRTAAQFYFFSSGLLPFFLLFFPLGRFSFLAGEPSLVSAMCRIHKCMSSYRRRSFKRSELRREERQYTTRQDETRQEREEGGGRREEGGGRGVERERKLISHLILCLEEIFMSSASSVVEHNKQQMNPSDQ